VYICVCVGVYVVWVLCACAYACVYLYVYGVVLCCVVLCCSIVSKHTHSLSHTSQTSEQQREQAIDVLAALVAYIHRQRLHHTQHQVQIFAPKHFHLLRWLHWLYNARRLGVRSDRHAWLMVKNSQC